MRLRGAYKSSYRTTPDFISIDPILRLLRGYHMRGGYAELHPGLLMRIAPLSENDKLARYPQRGELAGSTGLKAIRLQ